MFLFAFVYLSCCVSPVSLLFCDLLFLLYCLVASYVSIKSKCVGSSLLVDQIWYSLLRIATNAK